MSTSNTWAKHLRSTVGKIVMAFVFTSVISGICLVPAFGQGYERRQGPPRQGPQERGWHARERQDARRWRAREWRDARGRRAYRPYVYSAPLYVPPPIVYDPYPSPGISLFLPVHFR